MKKFFKVSLLVVLCLIMTLAFVACSPDKQSSSLQGTEEQGGTTTEDKTDAVEENIEVPSIDISSLNDNAKKVALAINSLIEYEGLSFKGNVVATTNVNDSIYKEEKKITEIEEFKLKRTSGGYAFTLLTSNEEAGTSLKDRMYYPNDKTGMVYVHNTREGKNEYLNKVKFKHSEIDQMINLLGGESEVARKCLSKFVDTIYDFSAMKDSSEFGSVFLGLLNEATIVEKGNVITATIDAKKFLKAFGIIEAGTQPTLKGTFEPVVLEIKKDEIGVLNNVKVIFSSINKVKAGIGDVKNKPAADALANATQKYEFNLNVVEKNNELNLYAPIGFIPSYYSNISFDLDAVSKELAQKYRELKNATNYVEEYSFDLELKGWTVETFWDYKNTTSKFNSIKNFVNENEYKTVGNTKTTNIFLDGKKQTTDGTTEKYLKDGYLYTKETMIDSFEMGGPVVKSKKETFAKKENQDSIGLNEFFKKQQLFKLKQGVDVNSAFKVTKSGSVYTLNADFSKIYEKEILNGTGVSEKVPVDFKLVATITLNKEGKIASIVIADINVEKVVEEGDGVIYAEPSTEPKPEERLILGMNLTNYKKTYTYGSANATVAEDLAKLSLISSDTKIASVKAAGKTAVMEEKGLVLNLDKDTVKTDIEIQLNDINATCVVDPYYLHANSIEDKGNGLVVIKDAEIPANNKDIIAMLYVTAQDETEEEVALYINREVSSSLTGKVKINDDLELVDLASGTGSHTATTSEVNIQALTNFNESWNIKSVENATLLSTGNYLLKGNVINKFVIEYTAEDGTTKKEYTLNVDATALKTSIIGDLQLSDSLTIFTTSLGSDNTYNATIYRQKKATDSYLLEGFYIGVDSAIKDRYIATKGELEIDAQTGKPIENLWKLREGSDNVFEIYAKENPEAPTLKYTLKVNVILVAPVEATITGKDSNTAECLKADILANEDFETIKNEKPNGYSPNGKIDLTIESPKDINGMTVEYLVKTEDEEILLTTLDEVGKYSCIMRLSSKEGYRFDYAFELNSIATPKLIVDGVETYEDTTLKKQVVEVPMNQTGSYSLSQQEGWKELAFYFNGSTSPTTSLDLGPGAFGIYENNSFEVILDKCGVVIKVKQNVMITINLADITIKSGEGEEAVLVKAQLKKDTSGYYYEASLPQGITSGEIEVVCGVAKSKTISDFVWKEGNKEALFDISATGTVNIILDDEGNELKVSAPLKIVLA